MTGDWRKYYNEEKDPSLVLWVELTVSPQIHMMKPQTPVLQNVTVFGERALREVIKLK